MKASGYVRIIVLLPFIILVRVISKYDPHLFRYWAVESMEYWCRWGGAWDWKAYVIALAGWVMLFCSLYFLIRRL